MEWTHSKGLSMAVGSLAEDSSSRFNKPIQVISGGGGGGASFQGTHHIKLHDWVHLTLEVLAGG